MNPLIETQALTKIFGDFTAVMDVSLCVGEGEVLALLGPNGAGKTTTIRMLASILRPTSGRAFVAGNDVVASPETVRRSVGMLTEHHGLYTRMRPREYLRFFARAHGIRERQIEARIDHLVGRYGLEDAMGRRLGEYSKGMRQKLALVRALMHDPPVLLLDEPTSAMDPASARAVRESIHNLRSSRRAIIVSTHNLNEAEALADHLAIIQRGRILAYGTVPELKQALLGDPIMELRLAGPLNGALSLMPDGLVPIQTGADWIQYRTARPAETNPRVLAAMTSAGVQVVTLTEVGRSLEEVYLQVVMRAAAGEGLVS